MQEMEGQKTRRFNPCGVVLHRQRPTYTDSSELSGREFAEVDGAGWGDFELEASSSTRYIASVDALPLYFIELVSSLYSHSLSQSLFSFMEMIALAL